MKLFDRTINGLEKSMDLAFRRHVLLSSNAANSETPKFRARDLDFAGELQKAMGDDPQTLTKTNPLHMDVSDVSSAHTVADNSGAVGADGNNVDLDVQMGKISANARNYQQSVSMLTSELRLLRAAIKTGGA